VRTVTAPDWHESPVPIAPKPARDRDERLCGVCRCEEKNHRNDWCENCGRDCWGIAEAIERAAEKLLDDTARSGRSRRGRR
jgi:hypothetical protein